MEVIDIRSQGDAYREQYGRIIHYSFRGWAKEDALAAWDKMKEDETVLGTVEGGELLSVLIINAYSAYLNGSRVGLGGIGAVSTLGTARNRGAVKACLGESLRIMYDRGYVLSALAPFKYEFYRKYGWELGYSSCCVGFSVDSIPDYEKSGSSVLINGMEECTMPKSVYDPFAEKHNGCLDRNEKAWKTVFNSAFDRGDRSVVCCIDGKNRPCCYAVFSVENDVFTVSELIYDGIPALKTFLSFVRAHSAQCRSVKLINICEPDDFVDIIPSTRIDISCYQGMMQRVVNAESALKLYPYTGDGKVTVLLDDPMLKENCGRFTVTVSGGKAADVERGGEQVDITVDIREFSQLMTGFRDIGSLERLGRIADSGDRARELFGFKNKTALFDHF